MIACFPGAKHRLALKGRAVKDQKGFTLVEVAIVLVIIGLIIGGVLKGRELIESAKVTKFQVEIDSYITAYQTYRERYRSSPLTDNGNRFGTDTCDAVGEACAWTLLRTANILSVPGDTTDNNRPDNIFGGRIAMINPGSESSVMGFSPGRIAICMDNIPAVAASVLDANVDDGEADSGVIRFVPGTTLATAPPTAAPANATYDATGDDGLVCVRV